MFVELKRTQLCAREHLFSGRVRRRQKTIRKPAQPIPWTEAHQHLQRFRSGGGDETQPSSGSLPAGSFLFFNIFSSIPFTRAGQVAAAPTSGDVQLVGSNPIMGDGGAVRIIQGLASFERVDFIDNTVENVRGVGTTTWKRSDEPDTPRLLRREEHVFSPFFYCMSIYIC